MLSTAKHLEMKTVYLGTLDAEAFWRDPDLASLPALPDPRARRIVTSMDELLFPCCQPGDLLLTRTPMEPAFAGYLAHNGFRFEYNQKAPDDELTGERTGSIFEILSSAAPESISEIFDGVHHIEPYAILPGIEDLCRKLSISYHGPGLASVKRVNSKVYSHHLAVTLGFKDFGWVVSSAAELLEQGRRCFQTGSFLIKDPFGVSGRGNLLINTQPMLERIGAHFKAQESKGKRVSLLLEPYLPKKLDFSCQMRIEPGGQIRFLGYQQMDNRQFAYQGSSPLDLETEACLNRAQFRFKMESLATQVYQDGYWGDLCIDAMQLTDNRLVPVVEINARKSMGLVNFLIEQHFSPLQLHSRLNVLSLGVPGALVFTEWLEKLDRLDLLFTSSHPCGILPLSANTLLANAIPTEGSRDLPKVCKGRLYFSILALAQDQQGWQEKLVAFLKDQGFIVY
jgi:hypothetical protein